MIKIREYNGLVKEYTSLYLKFSISKSEVVRQALAIRISLLITKIDKLRSELPDRLFKK